MFPLVFGGNERRIGFQFTRARRRDCYRSPGPRRSIEARGAGEGSFAGQAERGATAAGAWFSTLCALRVSAAACSTAYPARPLAARPTRSGQTLKRPQRGHGILALEVIGDAIDCTRVATGSSAARTLGCNRSVPRQSSALFASRNWFRWRQTRGEPDGTNGQWVFSSRGLLRRLLQVTRTRAGERGLLCDEEVLRIRADCGFTEAKTAWFRASPKRCNLTTSSSRSRPLASR